MNAYGSLGFAPGNVGPLTSHHPHPHIARLEEATDAPAENQRHDELEPLSHEAGHGQSFSQGDGDDEASFGATNHVIFS